MDQYIGRLLDNRYEILEIIGNGGMAVVYKARCHRLNRLVAIKILKDEFARDEEFRRRFHAEGEAVAMLSHPNIVQVYDVSSTDKANFIVMELIDGISLKQYMEKKGTLNWKETLHFALQIAKGLEHAHSRGIVHRDIKPHNVMVLKNGSVKVMDFGIARVMSKSNTLTKEALGSVHYISPEQAKGGFTDNRSDLYSLSVVMYEMMTGRPPYDGESPVAVAIQHINGGAAMPSTLNPNIPGGLEQIIMKGMALEVGERYNSATEMLQDMEEFRKNPAILFQHEIKTTESARKITPPVKPRTTAEKVVQHKTGEAPRGDSPRQRTAEKRAAAKTSGVARNKKLMEEERRTQQLRREEEERREEQRSRVATIAIVVCSAVAIIAIIVFLVALFNGALLNQQMEYVEVPRFIGVGYSDTLLEEYDEFEIRLTPQSYSDDYEKGQIMDQMPAAGEQVVKDSEIWITVSLGKEPEIKIMDNYVGFAREEVEAALKGQGFQPVFSSEASSEFEVGVIIRTEPEANTELKEGQVIKIWVSSGPDTLMGTVPDMVGRDESYARGLLDAEGFTNVRVRPVESNEPKGQVVYQSEEPGTELELTSEIYLEISEGPVETTEATEATEPEETQPKETEPEPDESQMNTVSVTFRLPNKDEAFMLLIQFQGEDIIEETPIQPGTTSFTMDMTGTGKAVYDVLVDGELYNSQEVIYTDD